MWKTSIAALLVLLLAGCAAQMHTPADIAARSAAWQAALAADDIDALVALHSDDIRLMTPNEPTGRGHAAIRASFENLGQAGLRLALETDDIRVAGDIAHHVGTYTMTLANGHEIDRGKFIETWEYRNGEWLLTNDIWNSDLPAR